MQIGAFAKLCETKISVLRHYDREGLLVPDAEMEPYRRPIASMQIDGKPSYHLFLLQIAFRASPNLIL